MLIGLSVEKRLMIRVRGLAEPRRAIFVPIGGKQPIQVVSAEQGVGRLDELGQDLLPEGDGSEAASSVLNEHFRDPWAISGQYADALPLGVAGPLIVEPSD